MLEACKHAFEDGASVFSDTARTRACRHCERVEVMLAATGQWLHIEDYLQRRTANRSAPPEVERNDPRRP